MIEKKEEVFEYVASKNFKDENGKPIPWKLKNITEKKINKKPIDKENKIEYSNKSCEND